MAVLAGQIALSPIGEIVNTRLTIGLRSLHFDAWPAYDAIATPMPQGGLITAYPVAAAHRAIVGQRSISPSDDWYHRIHIRPSILALGNVISTQVEEVHVWNAYLDPVTLSAIDGQTEGVTLAGPDDFPLIFAPLQIITWDVSVTPAGPTNVDVSLAWDFQGVPDARLSITGTRIVAWTLAPDWTNGIKERLGWATDILASDRRDEQRRALRLSPRREFDVQLFAEDRERALFDLMMQGWGGRVWAIPIWPDIQRLTTPIAVDSTSIACTTAGRDFRVGGLAMLRGESAFVSEVVEIETIASGSLTLVRPAQLAWPAGTRLYPARTARFQEQPRRRRLTDRAVSVDATFRLVEASDWPALALPLYRGLPVFDARPDETEDLIGTVERMLYELDNVSGIPFVLDTADVGFATQAHRWVLDGVAERADFRSLLYTLRGRQVAVWLPTHSDDLTLTETIGGSSVAMKVANTNYARFGLGQLGRQDIRMELRNGTVFMRRITNAGAVDEQTEQLTIDAPLGQSVSPADVRRISFMMVARQQSDEVEIRHLTDIVGAATSQMTLVGVRDT